MTLRRDRWLPAVERVAVAHQVETVPGGSFEFSGIAAEPAQLVTGGHILL